MTLLLIHPGKRTVIPRHRSAFSPPPVKGLVCRKFMDCVDCGKRLKSPRVIPPGWRDTRSDGLLPSCQNRQPQNALGISARCGETASVLLISMPVTCMSLFGLFKLLLLLCARAFISFKGPECLIGTHDCASSRIV